MTGYEFGDVVLVPFPFTNQTGSKRRPAVIVSSAAYHRGRPDVPTRPGSEEETVLVPSANTAAPMIRAVITWLRVNWDTIVLPADPALFSGR